jgi:protein-disulfide isomerase/uncharacterized membrane protein
VTRLRALALWLLVPLMLFGIGVGLLMTWHHDTQLYGAGDIGELVGCTESAEVNCDIVNTSAYSEVAGIPIATLAIPFDATVLVLAMLALRGRPAARTLLVAAGVLALGCSGFLLYISKTELGYVCAWCLRLYAVNTAILVLALLGGRLTRPDARLLGTAAGVYAVLLLVSVGGERLYRASLGGGGGASLVAAGGARGQDPKGDAPARTFRVHTEDGRDATLTLDPDDAWIGNRDAKVVVVMFGDLECGYCKRSSAELARLEATYGDRVLFVFKHFPMDPACNPGVKNRKHKDACAASKAAVCAGEQGRFWAFHDLAYKNQHELGDAALRAYAVDAGVDASRFDACLATSAPLDVVRHDAEAGAALDIHGTPRIFIDGTLYRSGASAEVMAKALEVALGASEQDASRAAASLRETEVAAPPVPADTPASRALTFGDLSVHIDTFEAAVVDGAAVSARHQVPALRTTWYEADAACRKAGRRLCTEEEWVSACQNARAKDDDGDGELGDDRIEGTAYPYGDYHDEGRCWDAQEPDTSRPVYTGEMPGCVTPGGVYDLTGNVEEWVGDSPAHAVLMGGAFDTPEDHARCYRRNDTFGAGYAAPRTGFRCCGG